jgi:hypothetical protein
MTLSSLTQDEGQYVACSGCLIKVTSQLGACNGSNSGGRDQEGQGPKTAHANSSWDPISKIPITKKGCRVSEGVGPEFKPHYSKKKKKVISFHSMGICCPFQRKVLPKTLGIEKATAVA